MEIWGAQSIQFVWFVGSVDGVKADQLYAGLFGSEPDHVQRNRTPGPANPFLGIAQGQLETVKATVQVQPGRVDVLLEPPDVDSLDPSEPPKLLAVAPHLTLFLEAIEKFDFPWSDTLRQSAVVNLIRPAANQTTAVQEMFSILNWDTGLADVSDPNIQLNRRKKLLGSNRSINRVVRYGVANYQFFAVNAQIVTAAMPISKQNYATSFTMDFNTVPDGAFIAKDDQVTIFKEIAEELLRVGEIISPSALAD